jgi:hypothetical protein
MNVAPPRGACGTFPLKGATPVAQQSWFHGVRLVKSLRSARAGVMK